MAECLYILNIVKINLFNKEDKASIAIDVFDEFDEKYIHTNCVYLNNCRKQLPK
jgi:hypothetical protein